MILFTAASLLNGVAQSSGMLIVGRGLQGLGGALVSPAALSIVTTTFGRRARAHQARWPSGRRSPPAAPPSACSWAGVLTDVASWRWVFFVNVPFGLATVVMALRSVPESRG